MRAAARVIRRMGSAPEAANQSLQRTGHATDGSARRLAFFRVSRPLSFVVRRAEASVEEFLRVLVGLLGITFIPLTGFVVVCLARRRPWLAAVLLGGVTAVGAGAVGYAAALGFGYRPELQRVEFDSEAAEHWFTIGYVLLTLGCPAWVLVVVARIRNGATFGPQGAQWVLVLFGYWMGCVVCGSVLYIWLTGQTK
jgi:hypothetical protein